MHWASVSTANTFDLHQLSSGIDFVKQLINSGTILNESPDKLWKNQSPPPAVFEFEENESMFFDSQSDFPLNVQQPWMSPRDNDSFEAVASVP